MVAFFFVFGLFWYSFTAAGINITRLLEFLTMHSTDISSALTQILPANGGLLRFLDFSGRDVLIRTALGLDFADASLQGRIFRVIQLLTQLLLIIGILRLIFKPAGLKFFPEYLSFCVINGMLLAGCVVLPGFAERFNTTRMYHLALITLAPFVILGCMAVWEACIYFKLSLIRSNSQTADTLPVENGAILIALIVLLPYFIFCSGLVFEISGQKVTDRIDTPYSIALSRYRLDLTSSFSAKDGAAAHWLSSRTTDGTIIFTDHHAGLILQINSVPGLRQTLEPSMVSLPSNSYIWLTAWNTSSNELTYAFAPGLRRHINLGEIPLFSVFKDNLNRIYSDGGAQVLLVESKY
jgi:uncharacterized membrane protein